MVALGEVCEIFNGITSKKSEYKDFGLTKVIKVRDFDEKNVTFANDSKGWIDAISPQINIFKEATH